MYIWVQNPETKHRIKGRSKRRKISTVLCSPRVTCVTFWCWYDLIRVTCGQSWAHCFCVCADFGVCDRTALWTALGEKKKCLKFEGKPCLGSFLNIIRWFCVVLSNHSPASVLMPFHVYSQKPVHLELSLVRGFSSERTELKNKELSRHRFLAQKTCKTSTVGFEISVHLVAQPRPSMPWNCVKLSFFLGTEDCTVFCWSEMWKKDTRERNSTMSQCCFLLRGDNYGRWQGRQGTEFFVKPFDPLCCTFKDSKAFATGVVQFSCSFRAGKWRLWKGRPGDGRMQISSQDF